jgi:type IV secretion system protein TrbF
MEKEFNQPTVNYKPAEAPVTPYQKAAEEWDNRIGSARVQAKNWRLIAFCLCFVIIMLLAGLIYQSSKSSVVPYVVQVSADGLVQAVGPATRMNFTPNKAVVQYFLAQFVNRVRGIPMDPVVAKNQLLLAYDVLRQGAANTLNEIANREQPLNKVGNEAVAVQIRNVVAISKESYQVRWEETTYNKDGVTIGIKNMTGIFTIEISPPDDENKLKVNPLGLYIKQFSWSRDV